MPCGIYGSYGRDARIYFREGLKPEIFDLDLIADNSQKYFK
jgi:hypothetical protein